MIDFRYHLISIVAVFLALGVGILMGSYVLGEGLVNQLRREFRAIEEDNDNLQARVTELEAEIDTADAFASRAVEWMRPGTLAGRDVVFFSYEGTDGALGDEVQTAVEEAGGSIASSISVTDELALTSPAARDQLALILSSAESTGNALRAELGMRLAQAATAGDGVRGQEPDAVNGPPEPGDLEALVADLEEAGYVTSDRDDEDDPFVPPGSWFIVIGGSEEDPPFRLAEFTVGLTVGLADSGAPVAVGESASSAWGLATMVRVDNQAQDLVATDDESDSPRGSLGLILALQQAADGVVSHNGTDSGAGGVIPEPPSNP
jgi:Copper transport outer membrane protein, MctB